MKRLVLLIVLAMILAACGGDSGDDSGSDSGSDEPTTTQAADDGGGEEPTPTEPPAEDDAGSGEGPSTATVTIGGETYEFSSDGAIAAQCLTDLFGIFSVQLPMADGGDGSVSIVILRDGTDPAEVGQINSVEIDVGDVSWKANPEDVNIMDNPDVPEGQSDVVSAEVDGNTVRGTLKLAGSQTVFSADFVEFADGTFEATCGEERTS